MTKSVPNLSDEHSSVLVIPKPYLEVRNNVMVGFSAREHRNLRDIAKFNGFFPLFYLSLLGAKPF